MEVTKTEHKQKQMNLSVYQIGNIKKYNKITYEHCTLTTYLH